MRRINILSLCILFDLLTLHCFAQGYNAERIAITNFLVRMYDNAPFEDVRIVNDYDKAYILSVVKLNKMNYSSESALNRVASVKAAAQVSRFLNGSSINQDIVIHTTQKEGGKIDLEFVERIHESSVGYSKSLELLTNFVREDNFMVFLFIKEIPQGDGGD